MPMQKRKVFRHRVWNYVTNYGIMKADKVIGS
jgi:hypothetical protein